MSLLLFFYLVRTNALAIGFSGKCVIVQALGRKMTAGPKLALV